MSGERNRHSDSIQIEGDFPDKPLRNFPKLLLVKNRRHYPFAPRLSFGSEVIFLKNTVVVNRDERRATTIFGRLTFLVPGATTYMRNLYLFPDDLPGVRRRAESPRLSERPGFTCGRSRGRFSL